MLRALAFAVAIGAAAFGAVWLADNPGQVSLQWQGWRVETSVTLLLALVAVVAIVVAFVYRLWLALRRTPDRIARARRESRQQRGYQALTRGMVAVAAGDAAEADRQVKRADVLLDTPPLTMLLSAQAAQLVGDETAAGKFFAAMLGRPEMEFLGVRGLLTQAMKRGDTEETLRLAHQAFRIKPDSEWVAAHLFDQQVSAGQWSEAEATLDRAVHHKVVGPVEGRRQRAVLTFLRAREVDAAGQAGQALKLARKAHEMEPGFAPACVLYAGLLTDAGKGRRAVAAVERTWRERPHPELVAAFIRAAPPAGPLARVQAVQRLAAVAPDDVESRVAVAAAALDAGLWGEARSQLAPLTGDGDVPARVCRLMAGLEEGEHTNMAAARDWLVRASLGEADPAWVCKDCGTVAAHWSACCRRCERFDSLAWQAPSRISTLGGGVAADARPAIQDNSEASAVVDGADPAETTEATPTAPSS